MCTLTYKSTTNKKTPSPVFHVQKNRLQQYPQVFLQFVFILFLLQPPLALYVPHFDFLSTQGVVVVGGGVVVVQSTEPVVHSLKVWYYQLWSFKTRDTKLERFLHTNQYTQRKLLNLENWNNGEPQQLAKIRDFKVDYFILSLFLVPKLRSAAQNNWKKCPYIFLFYFWFKNKRA